MAYEPLHHKYRPQTFAHLVGQGAIATTLVNALRQERIAPAYLFAGPRGTGKTSSARILAKSLNCLSYDRPTETPCGKCEVCVAIAQGNALDVIEIDAASNTGVDNIRELIERAQFAPVQCRYKVYTIDECHMLSNAAFNSLLKTLEEPPEHVVFVLATTDPQRVLPTIISRCQRFDFRRIPLDAMIDHLGYIATEENITIEPDAIALVAQIAQGGLRDAESLLDQLSLLPDGVTVDAVWDLVGAVPERDLMALLEAIASNHPQTVLDCARRLMDRGREPQIVLQNLASFYRDFLIAKTAPNRPDLVSLTEPTWQRLCEFAQGFDLGAILHGQQHLKASESQLRHSTQPRLWLEVTLMGLLPTQVAPAQVVTAAIAPAQIAPAQVTPTQITPTQIAPTQIPPAEVPAGQIAPLQPALGGQAPAPQLYSPVAPLAAPPGPDPVPTLAHILQDLAQQAWLDWTPEFIDDLAQVIQAGIRANPAILPKLIQSLSASTTESAVALGSPAASPGEDKRELPPIAPPPSSHPAATIAPPAPSPSAAPPSPPDLDATWQQVLEAIAQPSTKTLFKQMVRLVGFDGKTATAGTSAEWVKKFEKAEDNRRKLLMEAFQQTFQRPITVKFVVVAPPDKGEGAAPAESEGRSRPPRPGDQDPGRSPPLMRDRPPPAATPRPEAAPEIPSPEIPTMETAPAHTPTHTPAHTPAHTSANLAPAHTPAHTPTHTSANLAPAHTPAHTSAHTPAHTSTQTMRSDSPLGSSPPTPLSPAPDPTPTPPPRTLNSSLNDDDVTRSAKSFANFFNGELVTTEGGVTLDV